LKEKAVSMDSSLQSILSIEIQRMLAEESRLEGEVRAVEDSLSGLRDIDLLLTLAETKLSLCLQLMKQLAGGSNSEARDALQAAITEKALMAVRLVEGLLAENVSEDQKGIIQADPLYARVRSQMEKFLLAGGGGFLEVRETDSRKRRILSRSIVEAIRKYSTEDDRYPPLDLEDYPPFVRKVLLFLFPVMVRENPEPPPYGIEEGGEVTYSSRNMKLPLSQAIFYMENELLPDLEARLLETPGTRDIQEEIEQVRQRVEDYKKLKFFPRSTPVLLEKGYYTEGMTGYTADGEMLVPIALPVTMKSGTNLDRKMELVRMHVVKRIAGRGVSGEIDQEYRRLRSVESGTRGSSRTASMKLDAVWGYRVLRQDYPFLVRLADKKKFQELVDLVRKEGIGGSERRIEALIERDESTAGLLSPALKRDPPADARGPGGSAS
jgi:hypothetical protein